MKKNTFRAQAVLALVLLFAIAGSSHAAWISDIQIQLEAFTTWFNYSSGGSNFGPNAWGYPDVGIDAGIIKTHEVLPYQYEMKNAVFNLSSCNLIQDTSTTNGPSNNVQIASGTFAGSAQLTITGELWNTTTNTKLFTGTLLTANMANTSWVLAEERDQANVVRGQNSFSPTGGEFKTGTVTGLKIADFTIGFTLDMSTPTVTNFHTQSYDSMFPWAQVAAPTPEPASIIMLGIGILSLRRKKLTAK